MTDKRNQYQPIDCGTHSQYELAIMHRVMLHLVWRDAQGQAHVGKMMPLDLKTEAQQEYLIAQANDGVIHQIRLDRIDRSDINEVLHG